MELFITPNIKRDIIFAMKIYGYTLSIVECFSNNAITKGIYVIMDVNINDIVVAIADFNGFILILYPASLSDLTDNNVLVNKIILPIIILDKPIIRII